LFFFHAFVRAARRAGGGTAHAITNLKCARRACRRVAYTFGDVESAAAARGIPPVPTRGSR